MATVTGLTAARMQEIEAASVIDGDIVAGHLILTKHDGTQIDAGPAVGPAGPPGPTGPPGLSAIPGELKLWPNSVLPELADWGKWVWADGAAYDVATYPVAASHIAAAWKTFDGASDPGPGKFRVPDLRGLIPAGMDQMPSGARANRMTRTAAITLAAKTGKEAVQLQVSEMPSHNHGGAVVSAGTHFHYMGGSGSSTPWSSGPQIPGWVSGYVGTLNAGIQGTDRYDAYRTERTQDSGSHAHTINPDGSDNVHENTQPTVMVPYIVCLGG